MLRWGNLASTPGAIAETRPPGYRTWDRSAPSSIVIDDGLLKAGGLQLPSHFPKGGAQGWNRTWDLVDMEPKRYPMCYRASLSELVLELAHYLSVNCKVPHRCKHAPAGLP